MIRSVIKKGYLGRWARDEKDTICPSRLSPIVPSELEESASVQRTLGHILRSQTRIPERTYKSWCEVS
jgi:hypothetical protein